MTSAILPLLLVAKPSTWPVLACAVHLRISQFGQGGFQLLFFVAKEKWNSPRSPELPGLLAPIPSNPAQKRSSLLRKNQFQSQKLIAGCANPSSPAAVPLTDVLQQQLEIKLPDCKTSSVPFGIYNLTIPNSEERGKYKMENDFKLALGAVVCIWLWFYLDSC